METGSALIAALLASAQDATWVVSRELAIRHFNDAFSRLAAGVGVTPRTGLPLENLIDRARHPDVHGSMLELFRQALSGRSVEGKWSLTVNGAGRSYRITGVPIIEDGNVTGAAFTAHDVTDPAGSARDELLHLIERKSLEWTLTVDGWRHPPTQPGRS